MTFWLSRTPRRRNREIRPIEGRPIKPVLFTRTNELYISKPELKRRIEGMRRSKER